MMEELFEEIESYIENLEDMSNGPESLPSIACGEIRERLNKIKKHFPLPAPQSQASLSYQLEKLRPVANRMGLYDAADYIKSRDEYVLKMVEENKRLRENASEVFVEEMVYRSGDFNVVMKSGIGPVFAEFVKSMLDSMGGENFASFRMIVGDGKEEYYIIAGRENGKSIQMKYSEVCSELKGLKTLIRSAAESDNCYDILFEYLKKH